MKKEKKKNPDTFEQQQQKNRLKFTAGPQHSAFADTGKRSRQ